jgi:gliding motility-associated GldM-like protein
MSIPKEPRQLMINLMYLVLTALLALNVSAEVMNAFKVIDDSLTASNITTNKALDEQQAGLNNLLQEESKAKFKPLGEGVSAIRAEIKTFNDYVTTIKDELIDRSGDKNGVNDDGDYMYPEIPAKRIPKGKKNKDVTTKFLVLEGKGAELEAKVSDVRNKIVEIYTNVISEPENAKAFGFRLPNGDVDEAAVKNNIDAFKSNISLKIDENWEEIADDDKKSWADFRFRQMPVISTLPLLTKFQTDAKNAEALAVGKLSELAGGKEIVFNQFFPVINAKKAYVIKGEVFEAEISLGAYSSDIPPANINLTVDGARLPVGTDGKAKYSKTTATTGSKTINLSARVTNPLTGEVSDAKSTFEYEVGVRSANVSADKMNVFYIGVDNPVSVSVAGASSNEIKVTGTGVNIKGSGGKYIATATKPGDATVNVSGGGLPNTPFAFRVKRIPDPVARLSKSQGGAMGTGEFKAQGGVGAFLDNFDFDATCAIMGYSLTYVAKRQDPVESVNAGARYNDKSLRLVQNAKPGDIYYFDEVKAKCPGDNVGRPINSLVFKIK